MKVEDIPSGPVLLVADLLHPIDRASVQAPTEAGERLLRTAGPRLDKIDAEPAALSELREKPAGNIRITAGEHSANTVLWPALAKLLPGYPDVKVEIVIDYGLTDIRTGAIAA